MDRLRKTYAYILLRSSPGKRRSGEGEVDVESVSLAVWLANRSHNTRFRTQLPHLLDACEYS